MDKRNPEPPGSGFFAVYSQSQKGAVWNSPFSPCGTRPSWRTRPPSGSAAAGESRRSPTGRAWSSASAGRRRFPSGTWSGRLLAGAGVIANDFHDRKDLTPNLCALFVEPPWRGRGTAGRLLDFIRRDLGAMGIPRLYLVTDHTAFYERYGWTFLTMVTGDDHLPERMYTAPTLPPASGARVPPDTISP